MAQSFETIFEYIKPEFPPKFQFIPNDPQDFVDQIYYLVDVSLLMIFSRCSTTGKTILKVKNVSSLC